MRCARRSHTAYRSRRCTATASACPSELYCRGMRMVRRMGLPFASRLPSKVRVPPTRAKRSHSSSPHPSLDRTMPTTMPTPLPCPSTPTPGDLWLVRSIKAELADCVPLNCLRIEASARFDAGPHRHPPRTRPETPLQSASTEAWLERGGACCEGNSEPQRQAERTATNRRATRQRPYRSAQRP